MAVPPTEAKQTNRLYVNISNASAKSRHRRGERVRDPCERFEREQKQLLDMPNEKGSGEAYKVRREWSRLTRPPCSTSTPFGLPVLPDV